MTVPAITKDPRSSSKSTVRTSDNFLGGRMWRGSPSQRFAPPSMHWLRRPLYGRGGRTAVFTCSCGVFGCGGIACEIHLGQDTITWRDFVEHPSEKSSAQVSLEFDRRQYESELDKLTHGRQGKFRPPL
ncbi:MAG: hypothetical protein M3285_03765 [Actinomycetota bacterium]|nr:hypothetical protein [Actinomycetota bacterium]